MPNHVQNKIEATTQESANKLSALLENLEETSLANAIAPNPNGKDATDWYAHNLEQWGTKWGDYGGYTDEGIYEFDTAWSPFNDEFLSLLAKEVPDFTYEYTESGCDFAGRDVFIDGEVVSTDSWEYLEGLMELGRIEELRMAVEWYAEDIEEGDEVEDHIKEVLVYLEADIKDFQ